MMAGGLAMVVPADARAQQVDWGLAADTAVTVPSDTVRLASTWLRALDHCHPLGFRIVDGDSAVAALHRFPQCRDADFGDVGGRTLVGLPIHGDCNASHVVDAWRSASRRMYILRIMDHDGGCRAMRYGYLWLALPKLPAGWRIAFAESRDYGDDARTLPGLITIPQPLRKP